MKKLKNNYLYLMLALFGAAALSILLFFLVSRFDGIQDALSVLQGVWMPFIVGAVIAYLLKPGCNLLEERLNAFSQKRGKGPNRMAGALSIVITLVLAVVVIGVLLVLVVPTLLDSLYAILLQIPDAVEQGKAWLLKYAGDNETLSNYISSLTDSVSTSLPEWLRETVLPNLETLIGGVSSGVSGVVSVVYNLCMGAIVSIYMLADRKTFAVQAKKLSYSIFGQKWSDTILREVRYADRVFGGFINGRLVDSLIIGIICLVFTLIAGTPYAVLVSVLVGVTNIIPFFGPYIGMIPSFLLILMVSPVKAVVFLVFDIVLQQFDGNILGPRILGNVTGLSGFWVLFAILTFGGLFGFVGMLIGVPVFAVIYDVARKLVHRGTAFHREREAERQ
ncbi:MAG: AI-2E family transporter [Clostridiales bacterium]|nr:AI-2E family transporter [Clostridiales bacterium]